MASVTPSLSLRGKKTSSKKRKASRAIDPSTSARIRDNQRRSRERRREYVAELEQRLRNYEKLGVVATQEVQLVGRKVAEENSCLRSLLNLHGVSEAEIDRYVQFKRNSVALPPSSTLRASEGLAIAPETGPPAQTPGITSEKYLILQQNLSRSNSMEGSHGHGSLPSTEIDLTTPVNTSPSAEYRPFTQGSQETNLANTRRESKPDPNRSSELGGSMPCEEAADIIAGTREYPDACAIRDKLGCSTSRDCRVKNMTVFEILDG